MMTRNRMDGEMNIERVVIWFSAGVTSAVAAKLAMEKYHKKHEIVIVNIDTGSEDNDNFRFIQDCEQWFDCKVQTLKNPDYRDTFDVYLKDKYLVGVAGARCSLVLKKRVRQQFENLDADLQIFGYDYSEIRRAQRFCENNPLVMAEFPLIRNSFDKAAARRILLQEDIREPLTYSLGFRDANCLKRGCVKGQMGYWNHIRKVRPEIFWNMAEVERILDVAICKRYEDRERIRVFLDELPKNVGNYKFEPAIQCGLFCGQNGWRDIQGG